MVYELSTYVFPAQAHIIKTFNKLIELLPEPDKAKVSLRYKQYQPSI